MSGMLTMSAVEVARARADQAAERRRRGERIAAELVDVNKLVDAHPARYEAATGLHKVMLDWHEPVWDRYSHRWVCGSCTETSGCDCCVNSPEWPCHTYRMVLNNPPDSYTKNS